MYVCMYVCVQGGGIRLQNSSSKNQLVHIGHGLSHDSNVHSSIPTHSYLYNQATLQSKVNSMLSSTIPRFIHYSPNAQINKQNNQITKPIICFLKSKLKPQKPFHEGRDILFSGGGGRAKKKGWTERERERRMGRGPSRPRDPPPGSILSSRCLLSGPGGLLFPARHVPMIIIIVLAG